jgi:sugar/nucleoside kinase (ribokinase family)
MGPNVLVVGPASCEVAVIDLSEHSRPVLAQARAAARPVWCDIHDYNGTDTFHQDFIAAADVLFLNDDGMADPLAFLRARVEAGPGRDQPRRPHPGCSWRDRGDLRRGGPVASPPVQDIVDFNGAGDAFFAGFLVSHFGGATLQESLQAGHAQAARCLRSPDLAP